MKWQCCKWIIIGTRQFFYLYMVHKTWNYAHLWYPGHWGVLICWCLGYLGVMTPRCPGYWGIVTPGVPDTGESPFFFFLDFFPNFKPFLQTAKQNSKKKIVKNLFFTHCTNTFYSCLQNFLTSLFLIDSLVSRTLGSCFKIWIALWKITENKKGFRQPLIGSGVVVWWKTPTSKISCYSPFKFNNV